MTMSCLKSMVKITGVCFLECITSAFRCASEGSIYLHWVLAHVSESFHCLQALRVQKAECCSLEVEPPGRRWELGLFISDELVHGVAEHSLHLQCCHCHVFWRSPLHCYCGLAAVKRLLDADAPSGYLAEVLLFFLSKVQDEVVADRHTWFIGPREKLAEPMPGLLLGLVRGAVQTDVWRGNSAAGVLISLYRAWREETPSPSPTPSQYLGLWNIEINFLGELLLIPLRRPTQRPKGQFIWIQWLHWSVGGTECHIVKRKVKMVSYHVRSSRALLFVELDSILLQRSKKKPTKIHICLMTDGMWTCASALLRAPEFFLNGILYLFLFMVLLQNCNFIYVNTSCTNLCLRYSR